MRGTMPPKVRDHKRGRTGGAFPQTKGEGADTRDTLTAAPSAEEAAWQAVQAARQHARSAAPSWPLGVTVGRGELTIAAEGGWRTSSEITRAAAELLTLYLPLALVPQGRRFALAHLAQSLDGRIATLGGASQWLTGEADLRHTHRLRALADAVLVGAATVRHDDPRLTVRLCPGAQPVRVVLDPQLTLADTAQVFRDGAAPTLVLAASDCVGGRTRLGAAEIVGLPRDGERLAPAAIQQVLASRGLTWLFIEGGGVTVSRFLAAGALDRLQIAIAPVLLGSGRPSLALPEIGDLAHALRPRMRRFELGDDMLIECIFRE